MHQTSGVMSGKLDIFLLRSWSNSHRQLAYPTKARVVTSNPLNIPLLTNFNHGIHHYGVLSELTAILYPIRSCSYIQNWSASKGKSRNRNELYPCEENEQQG